MTHAKAPWKSEYHATRFDLLDGDDNVILRIRGGMVPIESNTRLIVAAPEMLRELQQLEKLLALDHMHTCPESDVGLPLADCDCYIAHRWRGIHLTIAKAEERYEP